MTAETVPVPRTLVKSLRDELVTRGQLFSAFLLDECLDQAGAGDVTGPPWHLARDFIDRLRVNLGPNAPVRAWAGADQLQAAVTDHMAERGVDLRDDGALYVVLAFLDLLREITYTGARNGHIRKGVDAEIRGVVRAIGTALAPMAPAEARG